MVEEPTRETNTLDLIITNFPDYFNKRETIPGLSDHDIIFAQNAPKDREKYHFIKRQNGRTLRTK